MSKQVEGPVGTFKTGAALGQYLRVKIVTLKLQLAGIADKDVGTMREASFAADEERSVRFANAEGTVQMMAAAAIVEGAEVFTAASGKISVSASTSFPIGIAMQAAGADGDIIEVQRHGFGTVVA